MRVPDWNEVWRRSSAFDVLIAAVTAALAQVVLFTGGFGEPDQAVRDGDVFGATLVAVATVPLVVRSVWALPVFLVSFGAILLLYSLEYAPELAMIPLVAIHALAASAEDPLRARLLASVVALAFGVISFVALVAFEFDVGLVGLAVFWGVAWVAGAQSRLRRERIEELEERARRAERDAERERQLAAAEERTAIARELHDSAGHAINAILLQLEAARVLREREPDRADAALDTVERVARETIAEIDSLVGVLREDEPADITPPPGIEDIERLVARHRSDGVAVTMRVDGEPRPCSPAIDRAAFRITQEALTNAARYGEGAARVSLLYGASAIELDVQNPIRPSSTGRAGGGHGIAGMRERVELLGGSLTAAANGSVFRVHARLPYEREAR
jgi:signal transduction histidine kinase